MTYTGGDKASYRYDANGNMTSGGGRTLSYSTFDKPLSISKGGHTTAFRYDVDRSRYWRKDITKDGKVTTTHYIGNVEVITRPNGEKETRRYINGVVIDTRTTRTNGSTTHSVQLLLKDHLGSTHTVIDGNKMTVLQRQSFDPFGQRRNPTDWKALLEKDRLGFDSKLTTRGFTGHEQLDEVGLVNMNGRVYDPRLGRFLQADPFVQAATNTQNFNRYSYVLNNPLNAVDPSGYFLGKLFRAINKLLGDFAPFAAIAVAIWLPGALGSIGGIWGSATAPSLLSAVASGFVAGGIATGSLKGAFVGAFSAGMFHGIGSSFQEGGWAREFFGAAADGAKVVAHGLAGGVMSVLNGGKFGNGFISAGFTQLLAPGIGKVDRGTRFSPKRIFAASIVGGTSSAITGGKFANGAVTGAFSRAFNDESHHQSVRTRMLEVGKKHLKILKDKSVKLYDYAVEALDTAADALTEKFRSGLNVKLDYSGIAGALGVGGQAILSVAYSHDGETGLFGTLSGGGFGGFGAGLNYSVGTWKGTLDNISGWSASIGGQRFMGIVELSFATGSGGVDLGIRSGINSGYGVFGFVNYTWELERGYFK